MWIYISINICGSTSFNTTELIYDQMPDQNADMKQLTDPNVKNQAQVQHKAEYTTKIEYKSKRN